MKGVYYKIGEFARLTGYSTSTLRDYERKGIILPHHKSPYGYRYYSHEQYEQLTKGILLKPITEKNKDSG